ncbi:MAG: hypothetical protein CMJ62_12930 [Planctomycetaceae bacterium]|nr:hypothetical protein [Planctomycetaceae bacterium]
MSAAPPNDRAATPQASVLDVELGADHSLSGQLYGSEGQTKAGVLVRVVANRGSETKTDSEGRFRLTNVQAGVIRLAAEDADIAVRCWTHGTAPPTASKRVLLTPNQQIQRGQRPIADFLSGPVLIGLVIAAAIAIPIAIHNSRDSAS